MDICHAHNVGEKNVGDKAEASAKPFGIRVRLAPGDPFRNLVGDDWQSTHWFSAAGERNAALQEMSKRHVYSRIGDEPRLIFEAVDRQSAAAPDA